jgi:hypothetical protein
LLLSLALGVGCAPPPYSIEPSIVVTWPMPETTVVGCTVVTVEVTNLVLTDFDDRTADVAGEGHYHVFTPAGYESAYAPYVLMRFEDIPAPVSDYLTVQLINNLHDPLLDADGDFYEYKVPLNFVPGPCEEFEESNDSAGDSAGDSGMESGMP